MHLVEKKKVEGGGMFGRGVFLLNLCLNSIERKAKPQFMSGIKAFDTKGEVYERDAVLQSVREYYGKTLNQTKDLKTDACCACGRPPAHVLKALKKIPTMVTDKFYGCGNPVPQGIEGLSVLDLGSGSGRDCYVASLMCGPRGSVTGVDMTDEQLKVARDCQEEFRAANPGQTAPMTFLKGYIEDVIGAGVKEESIDLAISNCVVNLSPNKRAVLESVYKALKVGGEFHFSDVYVDRRLPTEVRQHELLFGECLAGALYIGDFISLARRVGFNDPRELSRSVMTVNHAGLEAILGNATFYSITYRLFKLPDLEDRCEDYGQVATYNGTHPGDEHKYQLDDHHVFETKRPVLVCGNTASMLSNTRLKKHFTVLGDTSTHFGVFPCGPAPVIASPAKPQSSSSSGSGGCCSAPEPAPAPAAASSCCDGGACCSGGSCC